jgi:hypothetical protein
MLAEELAPGIRVRYPRTGTTGTVIRLDEIGGVTFAELDSTHLLYRAEQLIPAVAYKKTTRTITEDAKTVIERERAFASGSELQEALKNIDQSCEGGG